ncbi:Restriction enzyme BgcI subunit alpha [Listeria grayi]|uniref:HsdM family class I SAM-dependent methyltransferase n=1 Tax=Listeria grayi TaxID=1641 RepID=UPI000F6FABD2|nr:N-6 DNA methylase [Listeria grayi]VEI34915.1 Restriction enzyme BgcI subunit alpha [Listeria grayi]
MKSKKNQSMEPNVADLANGWLKNYNLDYKLEQEILNEEIDKALTDYKSKSGGSGSIRPDCKLLLQDKNLNFYPILIEYKGYKNKLVKLDNEGDVQNVKADNTPHYTNIKGYAVNGAIHYANALLHHTSYSDIISIGMTGYKKNNGEIEYEIGVYYVSKSNLGMGQKIGEFTDFSFLKQENFDEFIQTVQNLNLSPAELEKIKQKREQEIDTSLMRLNNDIYKNEKGLSEKDRVNLVAASIIATIGVAGKVAPLEKSDLKSSNEKGNTDGEIIIRKIEGFLNEKNLPEEKKHLIINSLSNTLVNGNVNKVVDGETQLKRVFVKIVDDLGYYYKIGLTTDFTGKLFNEMYSWLGFTQDKLNDVVLTPSYVSNLLVKLARVNKDSYVWDFATGSAGLLVAAMNEMLNDARENIDSPEKLMEKELEIKANQLLGLEILPEIYMLAILNMILMGDGSSNILNEDSLTDFDGKYAFGKDDEKFPANAFVLNPPYSAEGNGMVFVEKALNMMESGYGAIIIQNSAGSGRAVAINKRILKNNTLLASIKMPIDLFVGKSSVQTNIYVFRVNERHESDSIVKFIDFSNDGYTRRSRKKAKASYNLQDTDRAKERYDELVALVKFGKTKLNIFSENEYLEGTIDPEKGNDWNQLVAVDLKPDFDEHRKTISDYLSWEVNQLLKGNNDLGK